MIKTKVMECLGCHTEIILTENGNGQCSECPGMIQFRNTADLLVPVLNLKSWESVYKQAGRLSISIQELGQKVPISTRPLGVTGYYLIQDGLCRVEALKVLQWTRAYIWCRP